MSKQLEKLTEKALRTGFANLNGRYYIYYQGYSELESKWQVQYNNETGDLELYKGKFYSITDRWETADLIEKLIKEN